VKMPGTRRSKEGQRRNGGGSRPHLPKRSASSASSLQRNRNQDVVITSYTTVDSELPPLPTTISRSKSSAAATTNTSRSNSTHRISLSLLPNGSGEGRRIRGASPTSRTSAGVSTACLTPSGTIHKRSSSSPRRSNRPSEGYNTSSETSSPSASPGTTIRLDEDELTCAICLDLLHRPRSLPCGHTFCLLCLQNYVNSCRTMFTCPSCRGAAQVPSEGVMGLPTNTMLAKGAKLLRERQKKSSGTLVCASCETSLDVKACGHCKQAWCVACSAGHLEQVKADVTELRDRLASARDTLSCRAEEDETRFSKLEETIVEAVEEQVAHLQEKGKKITEQVHELRQESQQRSHTLTQDIEKVLASSITTQETTEPKLEEAGRLHATLLRLLKATSTAKGPRVTLDQVTLTLSTPSSTALDDQLEAKDEDEDERHLQPQDHSLLYRSKGSLARLKWGQHLGERPAGVAVNPWTSEIYVTGSDTCRVFVFDSSGRQLSSFGSRGHSDGQFLCPIGLAFSHISREVFITDKWKHCIHVFDTDGNFIRQLGRKGKGFGHFSAPEGIATDRHGNIYVADTCNHRVQILDGDGVFLREVGVVSSETLQDGRRYTKTEFNEPTDVAASLDGSRVYVADAGNHRIKVFDGMTGERTLMFGSRGRHKGQFESPECIVVDHEGFILVGDSGNGRVQVFRPNGNFVRYLGTRGNSRGEFGWVSGVGLSRTLDIVVTDFKNNLVAVF
ncbi:RING finger protein nhl-1-like 2, partial [Homarus americanus]